MKMNRFTALFCLMALLPLGSCLKNQADVFEEPSSARLQNYLEDVRTRLQQPEYGWSLSYYPGSDYASCYFTVKFTDQEVTAVHQNNLNKTSTSTYKLCPDDGPVLSFDTYNEVLHYYATPDGTHYQARGGDFEFDIMDVQDNCITLRGMRSRNYCYLEPLKEPAKDFLAAIVEAEKKLSIAAFTGTVTGGVVEGYMDTGTHTLTIGPKGAEAADLKTVRYNITKEGIRFNRPFELQGVTFDEFIFNPADETFTGSDIVFTKFYPEGWVSYDNYLGNYALKYQGGFFDVKLKAHEPGSSFKMEGLSDAFEPVLTYNGGYGRLSWICQVVGGSASGLSYVLCPMDSNAGYLTWKEGVGVYSHVANPDDPNFTIEFIDNGEWQSDEGYVVDGWVLWMLNGTESAGQLQDSSFAFADGASYIMGPITLTKIAE